MYDNGYIVKCRSILTNDICLYNPQIQMFDGF